MYKVEQLFTYGWDDAGWTETSWKGGVEVTRPVRYSDPSHAWEDINNLCDQDELEGYDPSEYRVVKA